MNAQSTFFSLIGRAIRLTVARFPFYAAAVAVTIALQWSLVFLRVPHAIEIGTSIVPALLVTLVYAFVDADSKAEPPPAAAIWERVLERSWAVIVIDFFTSIVVAVGVSGTATGSPLDMLIGALVLLLSALLVFADASATVDDGIPFWWLLPAAFQRSILASWRGPALVRAIAILAMWLTVTGASGSLVSVLTHAHVANADFWAQVPIEAIVTPPLAALTVLVYRDLKPREPETTE